MSEVRHPIMYSRTPVTAYAAPPRLGEHSEPIRRWLAADAHPDPHHPDDQENA